MQRTKTGEISWVDLSAREFDRQSEFYEQLLGWTHEDLPDAGQRYRLFSRDGEVVSAMRELPGELVIAGVPTSWNTYVAAEDVDRAVDRAVELGATVAIEPRDIPGSGRMAAITDPTGAFLFLWNPLEDGPTSCMVYTQPGAFSWADLNTRDPERAAGFYSVLFDWQVSAPDGSPMQYRHISLDSMGQGGILALPEGSPAQTASFWMPYFGSINVHGDADRASELGGRVFGEVRESDDMVRFAIIADPAGAMFALLEPIGEMRW